MPTDLLPTDVLAIYRNHLSSGRAALAHLTGAGMEVRSSGSTVWTHDGTDFLDCGGYGIFILGHRHPRVVAAVTRQLECHPMATRLLLEPTVAAAAKALADVAPPGLDRVHFVNSGAEAVEAAVKLARVHGRTELVSAVNGFHGKTMGALSLTARAAYQDPFLPLLPLVHHVPYGDADALAAVLDRYGAKACVVLEPVQGEAGVVLPPPGYLRAAARLCRESGALLVLDEVQTGLGRLGRWWGAEREDVVPDMLLVGKGLSGGVVPVAAMLATTEVYQPFSVDPFLHTSTFAGSPLAMAAAEATVRTLAEEALVPRAAVLGDLILGGLREIAAQACPSLITDVRGVGLLIGVQTRNPAVAGDLTLALLDNRVLVNHSLNAQDVVRFTPPAVLREADVDRLLDGFAAATRTIARLHP